MAHPELMDNFYNFFNNLFKLRNDLYFDLMITEVVEPPDFQHIDSRYTKEYFDLIDTFRNKWNDIMLEKPYNGKNTNKNPFYHPTKYFNIHINNNIEKAIVQPSLALRKGLKKFKKFYCCKGIEMIHIDFDGSYNGTLCYMPPIGNIYNDGLDMLKLSEYIICDREQCGCSADDWTPKFREKQYADQYIMKHRNKNSVLIMQQLINTIEHINNSQKINNIDNKVNKLIDHIAWWIPLKKWRDNFRNKILNS